MTIDHAILKCIPLGLDCLFDTPDEKRLWLDSYNFDLEGIPRQLLKTLEGRRSIMEHLLFRIR